MIPLPRILKANRFLPFLIFCFLSFSISLTLVLSSGLSSSLHSQQLVNFLSNNHLGTEKHQESLSRRLSAYLSELYIFYSHKHRFDWARNSFLLNPKDYISPTFEIEELLNSSLQQFPPKLPPLPIQSLYSRSLESFLRRMLGGYHKHPFQIYSFSSSKDSICPFLWASLYSAALGNDVISIDTNIVCKNVGIQYVSAQKIPYYKFSECQDFTCISRSPLVTFVHGENCMDFFLHPQFSDFTFTYIILLIHPGDSCSSLENLATLKHMGFSIQIMDEISLDTGLPRSFRLDIHQLQTIANLFNPTTETVNKHSQMLLFLTKGWDPAIT